MRARSIVLGLVVVAACGYPPLDGNTGPDGGSRSGSGSGSGSGTGTGCQVPESFGAATVSQQSGVYFPSDANAPAEVDYGGTLDATDRLTLWLFDGDPPFAGGYTPGTFDLSAQTDLGICGSCVLIAAGCNGCEPFANQGVGSWYIANAGTLTLTTFTATSIAGSLSGATLVHVNLDLSDLSTTAAGDGCTTHVASVAFSAALTEQ